MLSEDSGRETTIAAISTPPGEGGVAVIRISGERSHAVLRKIFIPAGSSVFSERKLCFGKIVDPETKETVDEVLSVVMSSPNTYTGEDIAEIHSHGGYIVPKKILELLMKLGIKPAAPGEFTRRAFLNGKMDLVQAEAVSDIISAQTELSLRCAEAQLEGALSDKVNALKDGMLDILAEIEANLDFPEEDIAPVVKERIKTAAEALEKQLFELAESYDTGKMLRDGVSMVILGKPNVGKSSILNCLVKTQRAIVSPIAGTTRDFIEEKINVGGIPVTITDTAGVRDARDQVEKLGVKLSIKKAAESDFVLAVLDQSAEFDAWDEKILEIAAKKKHLVVLNKADLGEKLPESRRDLIPGERKPVETSAKTGLGIDKLRQSIFETLVDSPHKVDASEPVLTNLRHKNSIQKALKELRSFLKLLKRDEYLEILSVDLRDSVNSLGEITGEVTTEDLLGRIFSRFCIGK